MRRARAIVSCSPSRSLPLINANVRDAFNDFLRVRICLDLKNTHTPTHEKVSNELHIHTPMSERE